jgi:hypothetical protein
VSLGLVRMRQELERMEARETRDAQLLAVARGVASVDRCLAVQADVNEADALAAYLRLFDVDLVSWFVLRSARAVGRRAA